MNIILFNKPFDVLCQFTGEPDDRTLADYIKTPGFYAAGRLDKNSEGLLILTNNGALQHRLSHPAFNKSKQYWVQVEGKPHDQDLEPLRKGLHLKDQQYRPAHVAIIAPPDVWARIPPIRYRKSIPDTWLSITLTEGKNHQIRKMFAAVGFPVLRLIRFGIADWRLGDLKPGEFRWELFR